MAAATIRPATRDDLDELGRLRLAFIADLREVDVSSFAPEFVDATRAFLADVDGRGRLASWLADVDGTHVGAVSVIVQDVPPLPERPLAREGYIVNMYVEPPHRGAGIGRALMDALVAAGPALGLRGFYLHATEQGRPLYDAMGFVDDPRIMLLKLPT